MRCSAGFYIGRDPEWAAATTLAAGVLQSQTNCKTDSVQEEATGWSSTTITTGKV